MYRICHTAGFPELGRYGAGGLLLALAGKVYGWSDARVLEFLGIATLTGAGVVIGKIARALCGGQYI